MVKIHIYTTILTNSVRKGNTFFRNHKRLHPKKTQNMLQNIYFLAYTLYTIHSTPPADQMDRFFS